MLINVNKHLYAICSRTIVKKETRVGKVALLILMLIISISFKACVQGSPNT